MRTRQPIRGKRPRNTGYSSQSINARSLSARITEQKKRTRKKTKAERRENEEKSDRKKFHFPIYFSSLLLHRNVTVVFISLWKDAKTNFAQGSPWW